jgi:hypothetical protein
MTDFELNYRTDLTIPVPPMSSEERVGWARRTAQEFVTAAAPSGGAVERIEQALLDLSSKADDDSLLALLVSEDATVLAPLLIYTTGAPMTDVEVGSFLVTDAAVLPPTGQSVPTQHLGEGFSSTLLERAGDVVYATRRWVFFGQNSSVAVALGPVVPAQGLALVEPIAEVILDASSAGGFVPEMEPRRIERLVAATNRTGDAWQI